MNLYEIRDEVLRRKRRVFDLHQLSNLVLIPREQVRVYVGRLVKKGFAHRVLDGVVSFVEDPFIIGSQLVEPSYVSFTGALYLHGLVQQVPGVVECVTTVNSMRFDCIGIQYHKIHPRLFFGYERMERYGSYIFLAEPTKAVLDMVYFGLYPETLKFDLNEEELKSAAKSYGTVGGFRAKMVQRWVKDHAE